MATIYIDGKDVLNGKKAIIPAQGSFEEAKKFRFIPNTDPKKDSGELGIIEVRFKKEKQVNLDMGYISKKFRRNRPRNNRSVRNRDCYN